ncbi:MAG: aminotransferase family protein, partial [Chloroflexota bacterium]
FDERGKRYISGMSGLWNVAVGYGRQELADAAAKQMMILPYGSCFRQVHPLAIELAAKLVEITGGHYQHVYLGTSGSEAVETALKMARQYYRQSPRPADRGRHKVISLRGSYHGVSYASTSTSGLPSDADKFGPLIPGFVQIEPPYCYRCPYEAGTYPGCGLACADALERKIEAEGPETVAAFVYEPVMGAFGIVDPPEEYHGRVGQITHRYGMLLIADEVTTGFGRLGKLFASEDWEPRPDILCLSKAISSAYLPLAATLATDAIFERFAGKGRQFEHGTTASGHPVCAAVGLANIDIILREKLPENAARVGAYLKARLKELMVKHERIGDVRGRGLMIGLEIVKDRASRVPIGSGESLLLLLAIAVNGMVVYNNQKQMFGLIPPLIIDEAIADEMVTILDRALDVRLGSDLANKARIAKAYVHSRDLFTRV